MTDLFWPGDERAGDAMSGPAFLAALVAVEDAWLACLVDAGIAPASAKADLTGLVTDNDLAAVAAGAESAGNPVIPLVAALRRAAGSLDGDAARWVHRGLTSQDVVDTALMLCLRGVTDRIAGELRAQTEALVRLAQAHRGTVMAGRTLTQHAVPITFAVKASQWLVGVLDAAEPLDGARGSVVVQAGGAAGTLAAVVELARTAAPAPTAWSSGSPETAADPQGTAVRLADDLASRLGLGRRMPWHTSRGPVTRVGDALVGCTDAWGRIAADVAVLARPEIGELAEPAAPGRGGSSTMPHKRNPVLAVLVRRAALVAPGLGATLHTAAAFAVDERPDGAWHAEWATLRALSRVALVAASQTTELLFGLQVDAARMRDTVSAYAGSLLAEQRSLTGSTAQAAPEDYLGAADRVVDAAVARATAYLGRPPR